MRRATSPIGAAWRTDHRCRSATAIPESGGAGRDHLLRRQAAAIGRLDRAAPRARIEPVLHRQFGQDARSVSEDATRVVRERPSRMRYLPHSDADRAAMLARIGARSHRRAVRRHPGRQAARRPARPAADQERDRGRAPARRAWRRRTSPAGSVPFFVGAGAYKPPRAGERRSSDPALRVPDHLHALSAGDRAGHAAISLRVPDPGRDAHRHGGRQRLDV